MARQNSTNVQPTTIEKIAMNFDRKEKILIDRYCEIISNREFSEKDIYAFLILVRDHLTGNYPYIRDFGNLIAHRHREKGIAMTAISNAIDNNYQVDIASNKIDGYHGIDESKWVKEWESLGQEIGFHVDAQIIFEISLCVMALLQFTEYRDQSGHLAEICLLQGEQHRQLLACTVEKKSNSPYICFFLLSGVSFIKKYPYVEIDEPVMAIRSASGELELRSSSGDRIV